MRISILDTSLRDGEQGQQVYFPVEAKIRVCRKLDEYGIDYVEAGSPGSNPKDAEFFAQSRHLALKHARLAAFGFIRKKSLPTADDPQVLALLAAETPVVTLSANCLNLKDDPRLLDRTAETIDFFYERGREVIFDASHFFALYHQSPDEAIRLLCAAQQAGAGVLCLCDTFGNTDTLRLSRTCAEVRKAMPTATLGIHTHNDMGLAVANTLAAVQEGFTHVQGSVNGYGEGCGMADLISVIATLELRLGHEAVGRERISHLGELSRFVADAGGAPERADQPFVGRRVRGPWRSQDVSQPFFREGAAPDYGHFRVLTMEVSTRVAGQNQTQTQASLTIEAAGAAFAATCEGDGPIHALDRALKQCLHSLWPSINDLQLVHYHLRVLEEHRGTAALARVYVEWKAGDRVFCTVGVSENLILASWMALLDAAQVEIAAATGETTTAVSSHDWAV